MNQQDTLRRLQEMQRKMAEAQEKLASETVEATAGNGMVTVVATCAPDIVEIHINRQVIDPDNASQLEALVMAAVKEALRKAHEVAEHAIGAVTAGAHMSGGA
jgi:nucleoid-associated protein EbfC